MSTVAKCQDPRHLSQIDRALLRSLGIKVWDCPTCLSS